MSSKPVQIGFQGLYGQLGISHTEFEGSENKDENKILVNPFSHSKLPLQMIPNSSPVRRPTPSSSSDQNSHVPIERLLLPFLSTVYTEIIEQWCRIQWLKSIDNQQMTFLVLNPAITGCLTVQIAINENCFITPELPLLNQPECLLIRTEYDNESSIFPNSIISLERLYYRQSKSSCGKLMAIICNENNSKVMFYKALSHDHWAVLCNDPKNPSRSSANMLSGKQQSQLEGILEQDTPMNPMQAAQFSFPLSALCKHPIIFVYIVQRAQ